MIGRRDPIPNQAPPLCRSTHEPVTWVSKSTTGAGRANGDVIAQPPLPQVYPIFVRWEVHAAIPRSYFTAESVDTAQSSYAGIPGKRAHIGGDLMGAGPAPAAYDNTWPTYAWSPRPGERACTNLVTIGSMH